MPQSSDQPETTRQLLLVKRDQHWLFRYEPGQEPQLLVQLARTARDPQQDFDWFDAAVLSHRLGSRLGEQLQRLMGTTC